MNITMTHVLAWLKQPTTILGLAGLAGTATSLALGEMSVSAATPLIVGSIVSMACPDNTGLKSQSMRLAAEALAAGATRSPAAVGTLVRDMAGLAAAGAAAEAVSAATVAEVATVAATAAPIVAAVHAAAAEAKPTD